MRPRKTVLIISSVVLLVLVSGGLGFRLGVASKGAENQKQIECLKAMWGEPLTLAQYERVRSLQGDPEAVRSYFLDSLQADGWSSPGGVIIEAVKLEKGAGISDLSRLNEMKPRAVLLLRQWQPGQTDIRKTVMPQYLLGGKAPLWDLYLTDPNAAWARGASDIGEGGK